MKLSVIVPVYNEKETIREIIKRIKAVKVQKEIIIVDDFSTDGTREILKKIKDKCIKVVFHERNYGKGHAIRTGIKYATGDVVIIQDADLEYDPQDYIKLIEPIKMREAKVVYGTRFPKMKKRPSLFNKFFMANRILTLMANILYRTNITDEPTCYKVFDAKVFKNINLKCEKFEFCPEVTAKVRKKGYKIKEIPISYYPRSVEEGKKIKWKDGFEAIWALIKYRFVD
jgi:glycosyltransferase involved in cell wall biosynthesis